MEAVTVLLVSRLDLRRKRVSSTSASAGGSTAGDKEEIEEECIKIRQSERRMKRPNGDAGQQLPVFGPIRREKFISHRLKLLSSQLTLFRYKDKEEKSKEPINLLKGTLVGI